MPIAIYGSPVLREKTFELDAGDDFIQLAETMKKYIIIQQNSYAKIQRNSS